MLIAWGGVEEGKKENYILIVTSDFSLGVPWRVPKVAGDARETAAALIAPPPEENIVRNCPPPQCSRNRATIQMKICQ